MSRVSPDRAKLEDLALSFLDDVARANLHFASSQRERLAALERAIEEGREQPDVRTYALRAAQLTVTEAKLTFWVEPVRLTWFERLKAFFGLKVESTENLFRLAPVNEGAQVMQYELSISQNGPAAAALTAELNPTGGVLAAPRALLRALPGARGAA